MPAAFAVTADAAGILDGSLSVWGHPSLQNEISKAQSKGAAMGRREFRTLEHSLTVLLALTATLAITFLVMQCFRALDSKGNTAGARRLARKRVMMPCPGDTKIPVITHDGHRAVELSPVHIVPSWRLFTELREQGRTVQDRGHMGTWRVLLLQPGEFPDSHLTKAELRILLGQIARRELYEVLSNEVGERLIKLPEDKTEAGSKMHRQLFLMGRLEYVPTTGSLVPHLRLEENEFPANSAAPVAVAALARYLIGQASPSADKPSGTPAPPPAPPMAKTKAGAPAAAIPTAALGKPDVSDATPPADDSTSTPETPASVGTPSGDEQGPPPDHDAGQEPPPDHDAGQGPTPDHDAGQGPTSAADATPPADDSTSTPETPASVGTPSGDEQGPPPDHDAGQGPPPDHDAGQGPTSAAAPSPTAESSGPVVAVVTSDEGISPPPPSPRSRRGPHPKAKAMVKKRQKTKRTRSESSSRGGAEGDGSSPTTPLRGSVAFMRSFFEEQTQDEGDGGRQPASRRRPTSRSRVGSEKQQDDQGQASREDPPAE